MIIDITKLKEKKTNAFFVGFNGLVVTLMLAMGTLRMIDHSYFIAFIDFGLAILNLGCAFMHGKRLVEAGVFISE